MTLSNFKDEELLLELLHRNNIDFSLEIDEKSKEKRIIIEPDFTLINKRKVDGYAGFYTEFIFNSDSSLKQIGIWE